MAKINKFNWQYLVAQKEGKDTPINDFDCMRLGKQMKAIQKDPKSSKIGSLEALDLIVNYFSSVITTKDLKVKTPESNLMRLI